jgi:hypothetical protein
MLMPYWKRYGTVKFICKYPNDFMKCDWELSIMNLADLILYICFTENKNIQMGGKKVGANVALM